MWMMAIFAHPLEYAVHSILKRVFSLVIAEHGEEGLC
jgi:hypothetical protein